LTEINKNYLGHSFVSAEGFHWYKCDTCDVHIFYNIAGRYVFFLGKDFIINPEQLSCNDMIIKSIIE